MTSKLTNFGRVGVIYGGNSSEREISLLTGCAIAEALKSQGVDTVAIDVKDQSIEAICSSKNRSCIYRCTWARRRRWYSSGCA